MTDPSDQLDQLLDEHGRMNFHLDCTSAGQPARIAMDDASVYIATTGGSGDVLSMPFADAQVDGAGLTRRIRSRQRSVEIAFAADADVERFLRVLRVRQEGTLVRVRSQRQDTSRPATTRAPYGGPSRPSDLAHRYRVWSDWAMLASTLLLAVAWIDLAAAGIVTLVLLLTGHGLAGLIWLLVAIGGFAMPFCLGALTRMVSYRYRLQD